MVLSISSLEQAQVVLARIKEFTEPIQRGDLPRDYPLLDPIKEAHADAAAVVAFIARKSRNTPDAIDQRDVEVFSSASSYLHTLSCELLGIDGVSDRTKKVLELCLITPGFMANQILKIPADA